MARSSFESLRPKSSNAEHTQNDSKNNDTGSDILKRETGRTSSSGDTQWMVMGTSHTEHGEHGDDEPLISKEGPASQRVPRYYDEYLLKAQQRAEAADTKAKEADAKAEDAMESRGIFRRVIDATGVIGADASLNRLRQRLQGHPDGGYRDVDKEKSHPTQTSQEGGA